FWNSKRQFPLHREESKKLNIIQGMQNKYNQNINADIRLDTDKKLNADNINENFNDDNIIPTVKQIRSIKNEILGGITFTPLTRFFINSNLSTENIYKNKITTAGLKFILSKIKNNHCKAIASTNEMVGTLASQSIGEPATQMTLNTFHYAGVSATVTKGVPRLKELINVAKAIRTPSLSITLKKECCNDLAKVKFVQSNLEFLQIRDILRTAEIVFDPVFSASQVREDRDLVAAFYDLLDGSHNEILSRW
ncbi:DNA-directed RNA polymerase II subunit RPB1, partial [Dictyocoela roeselum]